MKDSINRKAQQRERSTMAVPSDDRNGVVVNRAIDSTRGIPNCLVEERCKKATVASSEIRAKSEERRYTTALQWYYRAYSALV